MRGGVKWKKGKRRLAHKHKRPDQLIRELRGRASAQGYVRGRTGLDRDDEETGVFVGTNVFGTTGEGVYVRGDSFDAEWTGD